MTRVGEIYTCNLCGNVVEILKGGVPSLVCCDQDMVKVEAKTAEEGKEKHVPVMQEKDGGVNISVGAIAHPMEERHYIKFIEIITGEGVLRRDLKFGMSPSALFKVDKASILEVREFCTVHGLWKA
ncbi:MAG: desulfoferrodoxin [Candidatus Omnitrophica bacterium]|nr:desulfoferrodoxin [Candidatus Omnitrophota bacterium]